MNLPAAWRSRWWTWALPLTFALLNAALLIVHPGRTGAGFADMEKALDDETRALQALTEKEQAVETVLATARSNRAALTELYQDRFSTQAEHLTRLIVEVKRLAQRAGLEPASISYPEETLEEYGLVRMALVFGVQGTYPQVRSLINMLELSDLFLVLERVGLRDSKSSVMAISLEISTFFARDPEAEVAAIESGAGRSRPDRSDDARVEGASPEGPELESSGDEPLDDGAFDDEPEEVPPAGAPPAERSPRQSPGTLDGDAGAKPSPRSPRS